MASAKLCVQEVSLSDQKIQQLDAGNGRPYLIVVGNEKGGSGKSTTAMHIVATLLHSGFSVGVIDLDARQRTLSRYIENRQAYRRKTGAKLPMPQQELVIRSAAKELRSAELDEKSRFEAAYAALAGKCAAIVIDCPGNDTFLSRLAHTAADTLVTPINDSFIDVDLLARVDPATHDVQGPSLYAEMVWEARKRRQMADAGTIDWVVLKNRVAALRARNMDRVDKALGKLSSRVGFRYIAGLGERVIYRELFLKGLTLIDLRLDGVKEGRSMTMSHVAARQELRALITALNLPLLDAHPHYQKAG